MFGNKSKTWDIIKEAEGECTYVVALSAGMADGAGKVSFNWKTPFICDPTRYEQLNKLASWYLLLCQRG